MDWVEDYFFRYVTFAAFELNEFVMDFVADRFGDYAAFVAMILILPVTTILMALGVYLTGVAIVIVFILSPILLPIAIYRHRNK